MKRSLERIVIFAAALSLLPTVSAAETLATIDSKPITSEELEGKLQGSDKGRYLKARATFFDAKKDALDSFLYDHLLELQAKKAGTTKEALLKKQVTDKIGKITDGDMKKFYAEVKKGRGGHGLPPFEKVSDRIRQKLEQDRRQEREAKYFSELKKKHKVAYVMERPRLKVAVGDNPPKGRKNAPITIVEFSDFECPYCKRGVDTVDQVLREYRGKVQLYFRDFPLSFHQKAKPAAVAARCGSQQGKFWEFHDSLFDKQKELKKETYVSIAKDLKLDSGKFESCLASKEVAAAVDADAEAGASAGVSGTPAYFINGIPLSGAVPFDHFKQIIDGELAQMNLKKGSSGPVMP